MDRLVLYKAMIIYKVTHIASGKIYIGKWHGDLAQSRWKRHLSSVKCGSQTHFHKAIRKYGSDSFRIEVIACASTREELNALEKHFIELYQSYKYEAGYNMTMGGDFGAVSAEVIARIVAKRHARGNYGNGMRGKHHTSETIKTMRLRRPSWRNTTSAIEKMRYIAFRRKNPIITPLEISTKRNTAVGLKNQGISTRQIAKTLGVSQSTAWFWANNKVRSKRNGGPTSVREL